MQPKIFPVVLAGGSGTRLWPLSRKNFPKQFLSLHGERSLLQQTMQRAITLPFEKTLVVSNEAHYFLCQEQLQSFNQSVTYLLEPYARNTAPAIISAAHDIARHAGEDAVMLVLPSDHWIADDKAWLNAMLLGIEYAVSERALITFGIKPTAPKTSYGYIHAAFSQSPHPIPVKRFYEKPNLETAEKFVNSGQYFWNSGMFIGCVSTWLGEAKRHAPDIHQASQQSVLLGKNQNDYLRLDAESFAACRNESIDYAIMESTQQAMVIPMDIPWSDLGCWTAVSESNPQDEQGNTIQGKAITKDTQNCLISSDQMLVTTLGVQNQIIVATADAVLVADKQYSQQVKDLVNALGKHSHMAEDHPRVPRPWGYYEILAEGPNFKVKQLMIKPGAKISLQMHRHRSEHWVVVSGSASVINDDQIIHLTTNESTYIPQNTRHRLSNPGHDPLYVIEVQSGSYLGEDDIIRFEDLYQRETSPPAA